MTRRRKRIVERIAPILVAVAVAFLILGVLVNTSHFNSPVPKDGSDRAVFYYSPPCGCCEEYLPKLKPVLAVELERLSPERLMEIKKSFRIPENLWSCHTVIINGKYVEGHVPVLAIDLLKNNDVAGLALPHRETDSSTWEGPGYYVIYRNGTIRRYP